MTPKTNREKVEHIRAFDKEFNVKRSKELDFLLMLARHTNGPELTPEAWQQLDELYQHVVSLEAGDECPKKGPEAESEPDRVYIHIGKINHRHGINVYLAKTMEGLNKQLADYCLDYWKEFCKGPAPLMNDDIIDQYFNKAEGSEWYDTETAELME